jgi:SAM-dependent methyltransferase
MSTLLILSAALEQCGPAEIETLLGNFVAGQSASALKQAVILHPAGIALDASIFAEAIPYRDGIGLERNQPIWRPLLARRFAEILIIGFDPPWCVEEIVLACYLEADAKAFLGRRGVRDLAPWQQAVKPDFSSRPVQLERLGADQQRDYVRTVHRWLAKSLADAEFDAPTTPFARSPESLIYRVPFLSVNLADQTPDLRIQAFDQPFSHLMCLDGSFVYSSDFYRSLANFVTAVDGMETVLDVGCGSGLLACHLAGSGRYADVLGIDASPERISGARLHAELNRSTARFEVMSMADIRLPDRSVDISVTSYSLEQSGPHLARCLAEIQRVTRRLIILFEPAVEYFPTLPSLWHVPSCGWATEFHATLIKSGLAFAARPNLLYHYYNCGAAFVIDLESREHPRLRYPQLFGLGVDGWPGGVAIR